MKIPYISVGLVYTTPGGQAVLGLVDYFGGGFIIFVLGTVTKIIELYRIHYRIYNSKDQRQILAESTSRLSCRTPCGNTGGPLSRGYLSVTLESGFKVP